VVVTALATVLPAQNLCWGNGIPSAYVRCTPGVLGRQISADFGSFTQPNGFALLSFSFGIGPTTSPFVGPICLDVTSPAYTVLFFLLDATGNAHWSPTVPNDPNWLGLHPFFLDAATLETVGISVSKTVRLGIEAGDSFDPLAAQGFGTLHTATPLYIGPFDQRSEVFLAGGAIGSIITPSPMNATMLFSPLDRMFRAGPPMSLPRSGHQAVRLLDGRVLITGGMTTGGLGTASCELYDPSTNTMTPAGSMSVARICHGISLLPDGRVLAAGGFADWSNASGQFAQMLSTAQASSEIYSPGANSWTPGPTMASPRAGQSHTTLLDGRVLIVGGVASGQTINYFSVYQVPFFTPSCEIFDPATNGLAATAPLNLPRGFHGATRLANGNVLVTGGAVSDTNSVATCSGDCVYWNQLAGTWSPTAQLSTPVAFHTQVADPLGKAVVMGGFTGQFGFAPASNQAGVHDGTTFTHTRDLGTHAVFTQPATARAGHSCTLLQDGTFLVWGGQSPTLLSTIQTWTDGYVYVQ
jgi:hypothetical protein